MATLSQEQVRLRSAIAAATYKTAATAPTVNDDRNQRHIQGSRWINTATGDEYVCTSNEPGAAVWKNTTSGGGGGMPVAVVSAASPTVNDDSGDGYVIGQMWVNTTTDTVYTATDVTVGAAVWKDLSTAGGGGGTAASISAVPAANNAGTDVQAQLDNINGAIANVFFMGRLLSLATIPSLIAGAYTTIYACPTPVFIPTYNTIAL